MRPEVHIFFEGDRKLRRAFDRFTSSLRLRAACRGIKLLMVAGKDRSRTLDDFAQSLRGPRHISSVLLVDAEGPVAEACWHKPWDHLGSLGAARLAKPKGARGEHAHLMVQIMESWFLADKEALGVYYGQEFRTSRLPKTSNVEDIPKDKVLRVLNEAAAKCKKTGYHKTRHAPDLLEKIDPAKTRAASPWCERLFTTIESAIESP